MLRTGSLSLSARLAVLAVVGCLVTAALAAPASATSSIPAHPGAPLCAAVSASQAPRRAIRNHVERPAAGGAEAQGVAGDAYLVKDINLAGDSLPYDITPVGDIAFFAATGSGGRELWKSDGTDLGTVRVKNIRDGSKSSNPSELTAMGGLLYFAATADAGDRELWVSDGTSSGTHRVKNINVAGSSEPYYLANVNGTLFFSAYGPGGRELWKSNGTAAGTVRVKDLVPGPGSSDPEGVIAVGGLAFFTGFDNSGEYRVWRSDGTPEGTYRLFGQDPFVAPTDLIRVGNRAYFIASKDQSGCSLETAYYRSDGTNAGTFIVADEFIEDAPTGSFNNRFFYGEGNALRKANASETGSVLVKRFDNPEVFDENQVVAFTKVGPRLFVLVDIWVYDGVSPFVQTDRQLWRSDGTKAGTKLVKSWGFAVGGDPEMTNVDGELFFVSAAEDGNTDVWRSNGTAAGTTRVEQIGNSNPEWLSAVGGSLYWSEDDGTTGRELWRVEP